MCAAEALPINQIQGADGTSPQQGARVIARGIVTARFHGDEREAGGFFMQAPGAQQDNDPKTSEGLFVIAGEAVEPGRRVTVEGPVEELGEGVTLTAVRAESVADCGSAGAPVAPMEVSFPLATEALEGMLLQLPPELAIVDVYALGSRGQMQVAQGGLVFQPTEIAASGPEAAEIAKRNQQRSLLIDDGTAERYPGAIAYLPEMVSLKTLPRVGDRVSGLTGVLDGRGIARLHAIAPMEPLSRRPHQRFSPPSGQVTVAAMNLHQFFNGDGFGGGFPAVRGAESREEFERQRAKLVSALVGLGLPDVVALSELENDGYGPNSAIADLTASVNERIRAPGHTYAYIEAP
ncbi:MAG: hypothetical protein R3200_11575, partial [Xanthomonadales bacterium]|nr:hypothetical protein [Xanthomonadales bacterium]